MPNLGDSTLCMYWVSCAAIFDHPHVDMLPANTSTYLRSVIYLLYTELNLCRVLFDVCLNCFCHTLQASPHSGRHWA